MLLINRERGHYREISDRGLDVLTDRTIARSIHQGRDLRFPCEDRTDEVNKLFIIHMAILKKNTTKNTGIIFSISLRAMDFFVVHTKEVSVC